VRFTETRLAGAFLVDVERREDARGFFARSFCRNEFAARGMAPVFVQGNVSFNTRRGTLRGMHFQADPKSEPKLVRCTRGAILDVILDLRPGSPTFRGWVGAELTWENHRALYVPPGFAHGFQTLTADSEVFYLMGEFYDPEFARGVRWDDPAFAIEWPIANPILSERDASYPDFRP
jgi:dTDP-4-dehydrorhamnose 3,5-epimerase